MTGEFSDASFLLTLVRSLQLGYTWDAAKPLIGKRIMRENRNASGKRKHLLENVK